MQVDGKGARKLVLHAGWVLGIWASGDRSMHCISVGGLSHAVVAAQMLGWTSNVIRMQGRDMHGARVALCCAWSLAQSLHAMP